MSAVEDIIHKSLNSDKNYLMTLLAIVIQTKAKNILELGVRNGESTEPLLLGAILTNGKLTSVDINPISWKCPDEFSSSHQFIQSDAIAFLEKCVQEQQIFDFIFVDDWHAYEHVKKELELIDKLSTINTVICLHDLMHPHHGPDYFYPTTSTFGPEFADGGPYRAVSELTIQKWEMLTIPYESGLTLLKKKPGVKTV